MSGIEWVRNGICVGCEDGIHERCLDGQMNWDRGCVIECSCASTSHDYKKAAYDPGLCKAHAVLCCRDCK